MRKTVASAFLIASLAFAAFAAAPPAAIPAGWLKLIERLGSEDYDDRKAVEKELDALGEDVLPALRKAGNSHGNADVRLRAIVLAAAIEKQLDREVHLFEGHTEGVLAFALSPDGRRMASGSWQNATENIGRVWDVVTGKELFRLVGHTACVGGVAWSADGKRILTGGNDGNLIVWDAGSGKLLKKFSGTTGSIRSVALSPDGKTAVSAGFEREARIWDLETEMQVANNGESAGTVRAVAMLPEGKQFAAADSDGAVRLIDLRTCKLVRKMDASYRQGAQSVAASPTEGGSPPAGWTG